MAPGAARPLRLLTFTTLFPNAAQPNHGIFVENRLRHLVATGEVQSTVLAPTWWFPFASPSSARGASMPGCRGARSGTALSSTTPGP